ncbi:hypothetical protein [Chitinophaga sp. XS-30]|uniref:hypothetical protein n=1 Tax=Chitinophaga sp. XS-30 TaxID=2604421 RepID=UPI0011DD6EC2|nr:hypothetical protein [Chitinophaga sp. XS-30]QEH43315.1 hypothetical protein FW415_21610 [Chitinophaga sp. XS-30]
MYIKRLLVLCVLFIAGGVNELSAQSGAVPDSLQGEWEIEKAVVKVYAQRGGQLLSEKTLTEPAQIMRIQPMILQRMVFNGSQYVWQYSTYMETGSYSFGSGELQLQSSGEDLPPVKFRCFFTGVDTFCLTLPNSYYKDTERNLPVKQSVVCYFRKKNQP